MRKPNVIHWMNKLHDRLQEVNVRVAERMLYSVMYVNQMMRERDEESIDYHVLTTIMQTIAEVNLK